MLGKWITNLTTALRKHCPGPVRQSPRPNVLWICADDFTPDVCGTYGNRIVQTPCLDPDTPQNGPTR